eukprot:GHVL01024583.1.p1 GENE.GHVL01024583.1~~GHVL01024583.1.p1  ORF type:complete len:306 (+),score=29.24 GHVL01024583.1:56-973(+)
MAANLLNRDSICNIATQPDTKQDVETLSLYCKVASLSGKPSIPDVVRAHQSVFKKIAVVNLGAGLRCYILEMESPTHALVFTFSYFDDLNPLAYMRTGLSMLLTSGLIENISSFFFQRAKDFFWHKNFQEVLRSVNVSEYIFCGFSLGGGIAHAAAYLLDTEDWDRTNMESIQPTISIFTYGCARVGNESFGQWYQSRISMMSRCVILAKEEPDSTWGLDPICLSPPLGEDYCVNPNTVILCQKRWIRLDSDAIFNHGQSEHRLSFGSVVWNLVVRQSIFDVSGKKLYKDLHSVLIYYENILNSK